MFPLGIASIPPKRVELKIEIKVKEFDTIPKKYTHSIAVPKLWVWYPPVGRDPIFGWLLLSKNASPRAEEFERDPEKTKLQKRSVKLVGGKMHRKQNLTASQNCLLFSKALMPIQVWSFR